MIIMILKIIIIINHKIKIIIRRIKPKKLRIIKINHKIILIKL